MTNEQQDSDGLVERLALAITKALAISHGLRPERAENPAFHRGWVRDGLTAARAAVEAAGEALRHDL
jgi:hypothetical protein